SLTRFTWQPAKALSVGNTVYSTVEMSTATGSHVGYATLTGTVAGGNATLTPRDLTADGLVGSFRNPAPPQQPGSPATIVRSVDGRPTDALWQNGKLWFVATYPCTPTSDVAVRDCVRITTIDTTLVTALQDVVIGDPGVDSFMAGIGLSVEGRLFVVYSR